MATVAEIINAAAARQEAPTKGLLRGLAARRERKALEAEAETRRGELQLAREQAEQGQAEEDRLREMRREAGVMLAADTPDKWQRAQSGGLIDADVPFEMRDMSIAAAAAYEKGSPAQRSLMEQQAEQRAQAWREKKFSMQQASTKQKEKQKDRFAQEDKLRDEYNSLSKDFLKVRDAHTRVVRSAQDPSPAGDLALIFNYMKVLDPGSVVREGEFATAQSAGGVPQQIRAQYNRVVSGERLSDDIRRDFVDRSTRLFEGQLENQQELEQKYSKLAERNQLDPQNVVINYRLVEQVESQLPPGITEQDLQFTADKYGISREEVLRRMGKP